MVADSQVSLNYLFIVCFHTILPCSGKQRLAPVSTGDVSDKVGTQTIGYTRTDALGDI